MPSHVYRLCSRDREIISTSCIFWPNAATWEAAVANATDPASLLRKIKPRWSSGTLWCPTGTWTRLITAAEINKNDYTCAFSWMLLFYTSELLLTDVTWNIHENKCLLLQNAKWVEISRGHCESRGQHLWWQSTFYKNLHSSVQTGPSVDSNYCTVRIKKTHKSQSGGWLTDAQTIWQICLPSLTPNVTETSNLIPNLSLVDFTSRFSLIFLPFL